MVNFFDHATSFAVYNDTTQSWDTVFAPAYTPDFYEYKNYFQKHIIKPEEQYRPDKLAFNLIGDETLDWVLDCINHFTHGIKEYYPGREINYLNHDALRAMGIV